MVPKIVEEFLRKQATESLRKQAAKTVRQPGPRYEHVPYEFLVRKSALDRRLHRVVPKLLRARVLYLAHYPQLAGQPGRPRTYCTIRRKSYWQHMTNAVLRVARDCPFCARTRSTVRKHQKYSKLFPAARPSAFVAMNLLRPLPRTERGHKYVLVFTDRFSNSDSFVLLPATTAIVVANALLDH